MKTKRPEKRLKMSSFIDDEAVEVSDESDEGEIESKLIIYFILFLMLKLFCSKGSYL